MNLWTILPKNRDNPEWENQRMYFRNIIHSIELKIKSNRYFWKKYEVMNLEARKLNLINWISSLQEDNIIEKVEKIQKEKTDWWDTISNKDKKAINEGIDQLDRGEHLTQSQVRSKIRERFNFK